MSRKEILEDGFRFGRVLVGGVVRVVWKEWHGRSGMEGLVEEERVEEGREEGRGGRAEGRMERRVETWRGGWKEGWEMVKEGWQEEVCWGKRGGV